MLSELVGTGHSTKRSLTQVWFQWVRIWYCEGNLRLMEKSQIHDSNRLLYRTLSLHCYILLGRLLVFVRDLIHRFIVNFYRLLTLNTFDYYVWMCLGRDWDCLHCLLSLLHDKRPMPKIRKRSSTYTVRFSGASHQRPVDEGWICGRNT